MPTSPQKGDIVRLRDGGTAQTKPRPVLVVGRKELNGGTAILVAPFTTRKLDERSKRPQYVLFEEGEFGLDERSAVQLDQIHLIDFSRIDTRQLPIGVVTGEKMELVNAAIRYVFQID